MTQHTDTPRDGAPTGAAFIRTAQVSLRDKAATALREYILSFRYAPGEVLREETLGALLGMSRTPIRSALEQLIPDGLVKYVHGQGYTVAQLGPRDVAEVYDLREALECFCVLNSAAGDLSGNLEKLDAFYSCYEGYSSTPTANEWQLLQEGDQLLHRELVSRSGNSLATDMMDRLQLRLTYLRSMAWSVPTRFHVGVKDHLLICRCVQNGETERASTIVREHLRGGRQFLLDLMASPAASRTNIPAFSSARPLRNWLEDPDKRPESAADLIAQARATGTLKGTT